MSSPLQKKVLVRPRGCLSRVALLNNIGALLMFDDDDSLVEDAFNRFQAVIDSPSPVHSKKTSNVWKIEPMESDYQGLSWFYRKLKKKRLDHMDSCNIRNHHNYNKCSATNHPRISAAGQDHHHPLGLEYIQEPLLATPNHSHEQVQAMAYINWATLKNCIDRLKRACELAADDPYLLTIAQNNMAVLQFSSTSINEIKFDGWRLLQQAQLSFDQYQRQQQRQQHTNSKLKHQDYLEDETLFSQPQQEVQSTQNLFNETDCYIQISLWCNMARFAVRRNDPTKSIEFSDKICHYYQQEMKQQQHCPKSQQTLHKNKYCLKKKWISTVLVKYYIQGMAHQRMDHFDKALDHYNHFLHHARKEFGHHHIHVSVVLQLKGSVLFEQRNLTAAMLAFLASLKIQERQSTPHKNSFATLERLLYQIARTLHDKEEYTDALSMYQKTLKLQQQNNKNDNKSVQILTTMCNIARIHYLLGDVKMALNINEEIVQIASKISGSKHPFVAHRLKILGNMLVEVGRLSDAMEVFAKAARCGISDAITNFYHNDEDVETSSFAIKAAKTLSKVGVLHPHSPCA